MSLFISFEGGDGSGKSTQAEMLRTRLQRAGIPSLLVREPGTTPLGDYLRAWLKRERRTKISHAAEAFLFSAARAELVEKTIKPELNRQNTVVIADRYVDSTTAYQGYGRRLHLKELDVVNRLATQGVIPSLTFLLDCLPEEGLKRVGSFHDAPDLTPLVSSGSSRMDHEGTRRFEEESLGFHRRVRAGYLKMVDQEPERWCVIDATQSVEAISDAVWNRVEEWLSIHEGVGAEDATLPLWADHGEKSSAK